MKKPNKGRVEVPTFGEVPALPLMAILHHAEPAEPFTFHKADWSNEVGLLVLQLLRMTPVQRLSRNLKVLLDLLAHGPIHQITRDGVTPAEYRLMEEAQLHPMATRVAVYELLNIHERMEALEAFVGMYNKQKARRERYEGSSGE